MLRLRPEVMCSHSFPVRCRTRVEVTEIQLAIRLPSYSTVARWSLDTSGAVAQCRTIDRPQ